MAPLSNVGKAAGRIARLRGELGAGAARATGADIPRPKPVADALPSAPAKAAFVVPDRAMLTQPQVNALLRKMREGQPLTFEEMYFLTDPSVLPDPAVKELDNLQTSSITLNDTEVVPTKDNLTPNFSRVKESDIDRLYNEINNLADPAEAANPTQVGKTNARLNRVLANPDARAALYERFGSPEFAEARIASVRQLAGEGDIADAAKIDAAAQSRDGAGVARGTGSLPMAEANAATTRAVAGASMPSAYDGLDVSGLAEAFNALPDEVRLSLGEKLASADPMLGRLISLEGGSASIPPNAVAAFRTPRSEYHGMLMELDAAKRIGDPELEAAIKAEITRDINRLTAEDARVRSDGNQLFQNQRNALDSLRREMVSSLPEVAADFSAARTAAITPPAPTMRAPGARSVEVSGPALAEYELPGMFEESLARMRERLAENQIRPSNPVKEAEAKALAEKAGIPQSKLPVALQDRPENRSLASRGGVSQEEETAILELRSAEEAFGAATTQPEKLAAAQRLKDAQTNFNRSFEGKDAGRARGDRSLNKQSPEELTRSLFDTVVGWRDRPDRQLARTDVEFSEAERAQNALDAQRQLSYDVGDTTPQEMMPQGGDVEDLSMLGEGGKRGRLGGRQAKSRVAQALQEWFSADSGRGQVINPLDLFDGDTPAERAAAATNYIMRSKANTRIEGSPAWEMAREDIQSALETHFGPTAGRTITDEASGMPSPASSEPAAPAGTAQDPASVPAVDGRTNVAGTPPEPPARKDFSQPATPSTPEEAALEASSVDLGDSSPIPEAGKPAAGAAPVADSKPVAGRKLTRKEIEDEATAAEQEEFARAREEGMPTKKARTAANARRKKVQQELLESNGYIESKPAAAASPKPEAAKPAGTADKVVDSKPIDPAAGPQKNPKADTKKTAPDKPKDADPPKPKDDATPPKQGDGDKAKAPPPKGRIPYFRTALSIGGVLGGGALLSNLGGSGGKAVAGGGPVPVPPGGGAVPGAEMTEEDAINRALARLRGSRAGSDSPTYQTLQNWTVWR